MPAWLRIARLCSRWRRNESGSALLEIAVILPVLILLVLGVAEYGRVYFTGITVANAALAGAEFGAQSSGTGDPTLIQQVARNDAGDQTLTVTSNRVCRCPGTDTLPCTTTCASGYGNPQFFVNVTASKSLSLILRYPGIPATIQVSRTASFRVQ
ncbi:MAG: TadE/TadG family type IV pilus assembly protein [Nitrospirota bacterium]